MIPAIEALGLPGAQLTDDEREAANKLEAELEEHVRKAMKWQGCVFQTQECNESVVV